MTQDEYFAVEKFAKGVIGCLQSRLRGIDADAAIVKSTLETVIDIIDLHLNIARVEAKKDEKKFVEAMGG